MLCVKLNRSEASVLTCDAMRQEKDIQFVRIV
ncbi:hypothetical protein Pla8534_64570 [Lignipirellula cremea]|uniref:Uncharacterized protein n=1 Tax=Lignipirellula cremea TaxID=2528010 RepID=A0A518E3C3_9BACT|nr:hypothetical protein Pla8534_64570 [Lignipirellula cremea]